MLQLSKHSHLQAAIAVLKADAPPVRCRDARTTPGGSHPACHCHGRPVRQAAASTSRVCRCFESSPIRVSRRRLRSRLSKACRCLKCGHARPGRCLQSSPTRAGHHL